MRSISVNYWLIGLIICIIFTIIANSLILNHDLIFHRLGINRNLLVSLLWIIPIYASFTATYHAERNKALLGLSYTIAIPLIGTTAHYILGESGATLDLTGFNSLGVVFCLYTFFSLISSTVGTLLGLFFSRAKI